jgi:cytochrome c oxidase cbb3-type subunit 3
MKRRALFCCVIVTALALAVCACKREERAFEQPPAPSQTLATNTTGISLPSAAPAPPPSGSYEETAYAISQGKQLFSWFNCTGCHAHGGGNIGPPLMDEKWLYGHEPRQIFATIVDGRPNGMPSFAGRITDAQVWQLVAYVRSMSALVRQDAIAGRDDGIHKGKPEQRRDPVQPKTGGDIRAP